MTRHDPPGLCDNGTTTETSETTMRISTQSFLKTALTLMLVFSAATAALAQDGQERMTPEERAAAQAMQPRVGLFGNLGLNFHTGSFAGIPEAPTCLAFDEGNFGGDMGIGLGGGLLYEHPLSSSFFVELRTGLYTTGAALTTDAYLAPVFDPSGENDTASAISRHRLDVALNLLAAELTAGWRPIGDLPLTFRLGLNGGTFIGTEYTQEEELLEPSSVTFIAPDNSRTRVRNSTTAGLGDTPLQLGAALGVDYELPMNSEKTLLLVPEVRYSLPLSNVREDLDWKVHRVNLGAAIKYVFPLPKPSAPLPPTMEPRTPPAPPAQPVLAASLELQGVDRNGDVQEEVLKITVEEFINTQTHALLNYIFFDEGSSTIPIRYSQYGGNAAAQFSDEMLRDKTTLAVYHQMLNIIGSRMQADPSATITLTGTNMNEGIEKGNKELSRARAESIKSYLTENWEIPASRIAVRSRNLPALPSNVDSADGDEENRRVEITTNRPSLLEPVRSADTLRTVDPPILQAVPGVDAEAGLAEWSLQIRQGATLLKEFSGTGDPPSTLDWNIEGDPLTIPRRSDPLTAVLSVRDDEGQTGTAAARLPVEQITIRRKREEQIGDFVYDRFNLITFEFNSANLSPASRKIADDIRERIQPSSEVTIIGYSDRLGEADHNLELSQKRATNTARELRVPLENATGGGENTELYDNDLPEGRFYSRTVTITVKTPVNQD